MSKRINKARRSVANMKRHRECESGVIDFSRHCIVCQRIMWGELLCADDMEKFNSKMPRWNIK